MARPRATSIRMLMSVRPLRIRSTKPSMNRNPGVLVAPQKEAAVDDAVEVRHVRSGFFHVLGHNAPDGCLVAAPQGDHQLLMRGEVRTRKLLLRRHIDPAEDDELGKEAVHE